MKYASSALPLDAVIDAPDWECFVKDIAGSICAKQSPDVLLQVRGNLYELLTNCIPPELIFRRLVIELLKKIDDSLKAEVLHWAAFYEHRSHLGSKPMCARALLLQHIAMHFSWHFLLLQISHGSVRCAIYGVVQAIHGFNADVISLLQSKHFPAFPFVAPLTTSCITVKASGRKFKIFPFAAAASMDSSQFKFCQRLRFETLASNSPSQT
jgi:hypothetical protein